METSIFGLFCLTPSAANMYKETSINYFGLYMSRCFVTTPRKRNKTEIID